MHPNTYMRLHSVTYECTLAPDSYKYMNESKIYSLIYHILSYLLSVKLEKKYSEINKISPFPNWNLLFIVFYIILSYNC